MIKNIQPYKIVWYSIPLIFISFVLQPLGAVDLQIHDTYYVVASIHLAIVLTIFLGLVGGVYWLLRQFKLLKFLSLIHTAYTSLAILGFALNSISQPVYAVDSIAYFTMVDSIVKVLFGIFLMLQLLFIINIIIGLIRGKKDMI